MKRRIRSAKDWLYRNFNFFLLGKTPVIVYAMRRTGSVAVHKSLERSGHFTIAAHSFNLANKDIPGELARTGRWGGEHIFAKRRPVKIIALVRNPVDNMLSIFSRKSLGSRRQVVLETIGPDEELTLEKLQVEFNEVHCKQKRHYKEVDWFNNEIKPVTGIDVYAYPFDHEAQYCRITKGPFDLLVLRTEIPNDKKEQVIADFVGPPSFKLISSAEATKGMEDGAVGTPGEASKYGHLYKGITKSFTIPADVWKELSQTKYMQHFCSPAEIAATAERYVK